MSSGGLGTLAAEPKAIFEQKSKNLQSEFALISLVTLREELVGQMKALVQDMAVGTRKTDCGCVTEFFGLIHKVRESTYDLVEGVQAWQNAFTHNIRPQLMSVDYLVTMIHSTDFARLKFEAHIHVFFVSVWEYIHARTAYYLDLETT